VLQVDQTAEIYITLQPGEVHELVEVKEVAATLETKTSSLARLSRTKRLSTCR